jgi:hypothetical protein
MIKTFLLNLFILILVTSCNFESSDDSSGGGLFSNHQAVTGNFTIIPPVADTYITGQNIDFVLNHPQNITVTGVPRVAVDISGVSVYADYLTGNNTQNLVFRYTVQAGDNDIDGISISPTIDLNGGSLQFDDAGTLQNAALSYIAENTSGVTIDTIAPSIQLIEAPANATYLLGEQLDFSVNYDDVVSISATPRLHLNIGGSTLYADYASGSGTSTLIFSYVVGAGETDLDGISFDNNLIDLNTTGIISDIAGNNAALDMIANIPDMSSVLVSGTLPTISAITPPADATYLETQNLDFIVNINELVNVTGTPRISIDIGGVTKYAEYLSGTGSNALTFRYTVETALSDSDGISISSPLDLNAGTIKNTALLNLDLNFTPATMLNVLVDSLAPTVAITTPIDTSYINIANDTAAFAVSGSCNENGQTVTIEVDAIAASSPVGFVCDGASFAGTIDTTGLASTAHALVAKLSDAAANEGVSATINITKDITAPIITSVTAPIDNYYLGSQNLDFIVNLDDNTTVAGAPRIQLDVNGVTRYADYLAGAGSSALTFRYAIQAEEDLNGIGFFASAIDLNAGSLSDNVSNPINLNLDATIALPSLANVLVDGIVPLVSITSAANITAANQLTYSVSGTCSENTRVVNVNIGGVALTPSCSTGAWDTGAVDVSAVTDGPVIAITADHADAAGNNAIQATINVSKDTATPLVAITSAVDITIANHTGYSVSGTCTENSVLVDVNIGTINVQPNCAGGTWTTGNVDVSALADNPALAITADHSTAVQATISISKDTASPIVVINSAPNISLSNQINYIVSGTCSENTITVSVNIDALNFTPTCNSGSWTTGSVDVSSISDGASISVTADHSTAPQAVITVSKNTATPTVSSLSVPTTLSSNADLAWNLNDPGGFTVDDYDLNYRVKGNPTWLSFDDGININLSSNVTGLLASTTYEFRVRVQYDTSSFSDWSNIAEGLTKPDDPIFNSPNKAMNVGGSTQTKVVALYDNTRVYLNDVEIGASPLSKGTPVTLTTAQYDIIDADKAIYTAGRRGSGSATAKGNITWNPTAWAGKSFSFNATRYNPQKLHVYATENATITVKQGATTVASTTVTAGNGTTLSWSVYGSFQVASTGTILAYHISGNGTSQIVDPKPLIPSSLELIGIPSRSIRITADLDSTNYTLIHGDDSTASGSLNKTNVISVNGRGTASQFQEHALLLSSDRNISVASFADSNGGCAAPFLPTSLMRKNYAINNSADWVVFTSKQAGTIEVRDNTDSVVQTLTLTRSGTNPNAPYRARLGTTASGYRFFATVPVGAWYQPNNDTGTGDQDETILYGTND